MSFKIKSDLPVSPRLFTRRGMDVRSDNFHLVIHLDGSEKDLILDGFTSADGTSSVVIEHGDTRLFKKVSEKRYRK